MGSAEETAASAPPHKQPPPSKIPAHPPSTTPPPAPATPQEPPVTLSYSADWATAVQAYYNAGAAAASGGGPPPHFYSPPVWGSQMMSPYGTPIPYSPMYHPVYAHPSAATAPGYPAAESVSNKSKGGSRDGGGPGKSGDEGKVTSRSADDYGSQSGGENGSESSSGTRDDGTEGQDAARKRSFGKAFTEGKSLQLVTAAPNNGTTADSSYCGRKRTVSKLPVSAPGRATIPGPATNLNIGMGLWGASHVAPKVRPNSANVAAAATVGVMTEHQWTQDERELKRERRKQSNRESARRSRLRKQQECEDLAWKVTELNSENSALKSELEQLNKLCKDLEADNASITEKLSHMAKTGLASDLASDFEGVNGNSSNPAQAVASEGGGHVPQNRMGLN